MTKIHLPSDPGEIACYGRGTIRQARKRFGDQLPAAPYGATHAAIFDVQEGASDQIVRVVVWCKGNPDARAVRTYIVGKWETVVPYDAAARGFGIAFDAFTLAQTLARGGARSPPTVSA